MIETAESVRESMQSMSDANPESDGSLDRSELLKRQHLLVRRGQPIKSNRNALIRLLSRMGDSDAKPPTKEHPLALESILAKLDSQQRAAVEHELGNLRTKMTTYRALALANQTVAIYAMDFYGAMLGQSPASDPYNASGQTTRQWTTATNVQRSC